MGGFQVDAYHLFLHGKCFHALTFPWLLRNRFSRGSEKRAALGCGVPKEHTFSTWGAVFPRRAWWKLDLEVDEMRYLVTGGLGFIGSAFVRGIRAEEPESQIVVLDALSYAGNLENVQGCLEDGRLFFPSSWKTCRVAWKMGGFSFHPGKRIGKSVSCGFWDFPGLWS